MKLQRQLMLVSLLMLIVPWAGCQYVREIDGAIRYGQEQALEATARAVALEVAPNPNAEDLRLTESYSPASGKVAVKILGEGLLPIRGGSELVGGRASKALFSWLLVLPPVAFLGLVAARIRENVHAVARRQQEISDHPGDGLCGQRLECFGDGRHTRHVIAGAHEPAFNEGDHSGIIIDHKDL